MKNKIKKWHIALMSCIALFIAVFASLFSLRADTVDEETGEVLTDNWELDIVFYDSSVDNGKTPLTEINWDASDGGYGKGTPRVITVQINYKNNSAVTTYQPGELTLTIDSLLKGAHVTSIGTEGQHLYQVITVGANDSTHIGYDWNYTYTLDSDNSVWYSQNEIGSFIFTNANMIEEKSNFEGSIQIVYSITPWKNDGTYFGGDSYKDEHVYSHNKKLIATLNNTLTSNEIAFDYTRTYVHPWNRILFTLDKTATKITSMDGLPAGNYYWVKYEFRVGDGLYNSSQSYPYIYLNKLKIVDLFPEECCVYDASLNQLYSEDNSYSIELNYNQYIMNDYTRYRTYILVGYPKEIYNAESSNLEITNTADLYVEYLDNLGNYTYQDTDDVALNLANFEFSYSGELYGITKNVIGNMYYEAISGQDPYLDKNYISSYIYPTTIYTGKNMDIIIGDDLLYITAADGSYRRLLENEYYFSSITFPFCLYNGHGNKIEKDKYDIELWVKTTDSSTYTLYTTFKNPCSDTTSDRIDFSFTQEQNITGFYFKIKNIEESIIAINNNNYSIQSTINIYNAQNISETGEIYNFAFLQVYSDGILQNQPTLDSYANLITQEEIASFDQNNYNTYLQRDFDFETYTNYVAPKLATKINPSKSMSSFIQDSSDEKFYGKATLSVNIDSLCNDGISNYELKTYGKLIPDEQKFIGFEMYDLLPEGMFLESDISEIINTLTIKYEKGNYSSVYDNNGNLLTKNDLYNLIKENLSISIIQNYHNTGRTMINIKSSFENMPLIIRNNGYDVIISFSYDYSISYDTFLEHGNVWTNRIYFKPYKRDIDISSSNSIYFYTGSTANVIKDNGNIDIQESDINNNQNTNESIVYAKASQTITSVVSTHQDVTTYVKTDQSNYSTGIVDALCNSEYKYKLRVRTGSADVTNLRIYTNIEEAQPERTRWKGEFLGIDTSYAESKGYIVKPYYSENPNAKKLYNDDGTLNSDWKEYFEPQEELRSNGLAITFNSNFKTESINCDYVDIYYILEGTTYKLGRWGGTELAGQTIQVPANDFYLYWRTDGSVCNYYGFSIDSIVPTYVENTNITTGTIPSYTIEEISGDTYPDSAFGSYTHGNYGNSVNKLWHYTYGDELPIIQEYQEGTDKSKVKSLAFEYLDSNGNAAILPANSLTYVLINMKSPANESITTLARMDCWTEWNALDDYDQLVDFITGINSNVVKVALPNSVKSDDLPNISLKFTKEIQGETSDFENLKLNKADEQIFMIRLTSLTTNDDGTYNQVTGLLSSTQGLVITQIPIGTYLLEELGDNYFDFVEFTDNNDSEIIIEGVTFEQTDQGYIITVSEDLTETVEFNIKVTNKTEDERYYEDKEYKENLFLKNKLESEEDPI